MFALFKKAKTELKAVFLAPSGQEFPIAGKQTILEAALAAGVEFPHNCRVGSCTQCKCRLIEGDVRELSDTSYVLTAEEIKNRYVLACQTLAKSSAVRVELDATARAKNAATIVSITALTADIVSLRLSLATPITYRAGQYALLHVPGLTQARAYSFADTKSGHTSDVEFHVRRVRDGQASTWLTSAANTNAALTLSGPFGDFGHTLESTPIVAVAGGSGLGAIYAILREKAEKGHWNPVVFFYGARNADELFYEAQLDALRQRWQAPFAFVPIVSGLVTEHLTADLWARTGTSQRLSDCHALLCGAPGMIDAAVGRLTMLGIKPEHIAFDKFV